MNPSSPLRPPFAAPKHPRMCLLLSLSAGKVARARQSREILFKMAPLTPTRWSPAACW